MRVTCEKCQAVYAVDDKLIPAKGARAQCPKCKALQIVRRSEGAPAPSPAASPAPAPAPTPVKKAPTPRPAGAAPKPAPATSAPSAFDELLGMVAAAPPTAPKNVPPADPFADLGDLGSKPMGDPFGTGAPPPGSAAGPDPFASLDLSAQLGGASPLVGLGPSPGAADPFAALAPPSQGAAPFGGPPAGSAEASDPFAGFGGAPLGKPAAPVGGPPAPAKPAIVSFPSRTPAPADPFAGPAAKAGAGAGSFDDLFGGAAPAPAVAAPVPSGPVVRCRTCNKALTDPFDATLGLCEPCRNKEQKSAEPPPEEIKPKIVVGGAAAPAPAPVDPFENIELDRPAPATAPAPRPSPSPKPSASPAPAKPVARPAPARPVMRASGGGAGKWIALVVVLALGGGGWAWFARPEFIFGKKVVAKPVLPAIQARLLDWKLAAVGLSGTASEHVAKGRAAFLADKPTSYLEAEEEFKAAVVLEPTDLRAVAYYVEAFAVGRGERVPTQGAEEAKALIDAVLEAEPILAVAHRAKASLLLATGQLQHARVVAEDALKLSPPEEVAEALLGLGCTYLRDSAPIALEKIDAALKKDPSLKRAWYYRGLAHEHAGRFASALADFSQRLKLDPDQREALRASARLHARLGDYRSARNALAEFAGRHPTVGEPRVLLVQIAYAVERDLREAEQTLKALKKDEGRFDDGDKVQLHSLWAAVARERGDLKTAKERIAEALKLDPNWGPAHFQKMLVALADNDPETARTALRACEDRLEDPSRAAEYLARIELAAGNPDKALMAYRVAWDKAPTRIGPKLNVAALLMKKGDFDQAWSVMRRAMDSDTTSIAQQRRQVSDYFEAPVESVRATARAFDVKPDDVNWLPAVYAAVAQYHLGELDRPQAALDRALQSDPSSLGALLYRAQIEIDRKRFDKAAAFAKRAIDAERQSAVAHYLLGRADEGLKKLDAARSHYLRALERDPALVPANARLGALAAADDAEGAKKWLLTALATDPDNLEARIALFKMGY